MLRNRNFSFMFTGRILSNMGDSIYYVAAMWLVYELGGSAFYTGLAGFLTMLPTVLQFLIGPLVDRFSTKKLLTIVQLFQAGLILMIPVAHFIGYLNVAVILTIMPVVSMMNQFTYPAQTAALPRIIKKEQLVKGNALFTFAYQGVDMIFNALTGILLPLIGAIILFMMDSAVFLAAALVYSALCLPEKKSTTKRTLKESTLQYKKELAEGVMIVFRSYLAIFLVASVVANGAIGATYAILPVYTGESAGASWYGWYLGAISLGLLSGAALAPILTRFPLGLLTITLFFIGGGSWILSGLSGVSIMGLVLFGIAWLPIGATNIITGAAIQSIMPSHLMGRVFSVVASMSAMAMPLGSLLGGSMANRWGSGTIFISAAGAIIFISIFWLSVSKLRRLPSSHELSAADLLLPENSHSTNVG
ncbi:MFS transporter [Rossellomorea marisflavi]|uniref:MFS transporter n=1 Tax=Rossellomorea marisflavi TaxID=189381 RepID=UPI00201E10D9|nr:MFS transporter [Rossellomorea marisflavi]